MTFSYKPNDHKKWKYILTEPTSFQLNSDWADIEFKEEYFELKDLRLTIKKDYAWNGLTGFFDRKDWLRASLFHDCLLGENRERIEALDYNHVTYEHIHKVFKQVLKQDTGKFWSNLLYWGVLIGHPLTMRGKS